MSNKGDHTKNSLIEIAAELFSEKGYSAVTMEDFCAQSGLSRGGLYRHFSSTKEIFIAMLERDRDHSSAQLDLAIAQQIPAPQLLRFMIQHQKQEILAGKGRLSVAIYEFCTVEDEQKVFLQHRFEAAVHTLTKMIQYGQARHEFGAVAAGETARHIVLFFEGLKLASSTIPLSEAMLDEQFILICRMLDKNGEDFNEKSPVGG